MAAYDGAGGAGTPPEQWTGYSNFYDGSSSSDLSSDSDLPDEVADLLPEWFVTWDVEGYGLADGPGRTHRFAELTMQQQDTEETRIAELRKEVFEASGYAALYRQHGTFRDRLSPVTAHHNIPFVTAMARQAGYLPHRRGASEHGAPERDLSTRCLLGRGYAYPVVTPSFTAYAKERWPDELVLAQDDGSLMNDLKRRFALDVFLHRVGYELLNKNAMRIPNLRNSNAYVVRDCIPTRQALDTLKKEPFGMASVRYDHNISAGGWSDGDGSPKTYDVIIHPDMRPVALARLDTFRDRVAAHLAEGGVFMGLTYNSIDAQNATEILGARFDCKCDMLLPHDGWGEWNLPRYLIVARPRED